MSMKGINITEDEYKFYLSIEKNSPENRELIAKISELAKGVPIGTLDGLIPGLPTTEPAPEYTPSKGYIAYAEAVGKIRRCELEGQEKEDTIKKISQMVAILKKGRPQSDDDLKFCVYHMPEVFNERITKVVLEGMNLSSLDEIKADDIATLEKAYSLAADSLNIK